MSRVNSSDGVTLFKILTSVRAIRPPHLWQVIGGRRIFAMLVHLALGPTIRN